MINVLLTVGIVFIIGALILKILRPIFWVIIVVLALGFIITRIPSHNSTVDSLRLVVGLIGHMAWHSIRNGASHYQHWGEKLTHSQLLHRL